MYTVLVWGAVRRGGHDVQVGVIDVKQEHRVYVRWCCAPSPGRNRPACLPLISGLPGTDARSRQSRPSSGTPHSLADGVLSRRATVRQTHAPGQAEPTSSALPFPYIRGTNLITRTERGTAGPRGVVRCVRAG